MAGPLLDPADGPWPAVDEGPHDEPAGERFEGWELELWAPDASLGLLIALVRPPAPAPLWYWAALVRAGQPLVLVVDLAVPRRSDPLLVKADGVWAEHLVEVPFAQWAIANEAMAVALDDPLDGLGRAYGEVTPIAVDLEWYAIAAAGPLTGPWAAAGLDGYEQLGEVEGLVELAGGPLVLPGVAALRRHWWGPAPWWSAPVPDDADRASRRPDVAVLLERDGRQAAVLADLSVTGWTTRWQPRPLPPGGA